MGTESSQTIQSGEMDYFHLEYEMKGFWIVTVVTQEAKRETSSASIFSNISG